MDNKINLFPANSVPEIVFDTEPGYAAFHRRAWELAWEHVIEYPGAPRSPYMDEAHTPGRIWIWDTCFMALFCKYAPDRFPGVETNRPFRLRIGDRQWNVPSGVTVLQETTK